MRPRRALAAAALLALTGCGEPEAPPASDPSRPTSSPDRPAPVASPTASDAEREAGQVLRARTADGRRITAYVHAPVPGDLKSCFDDTGATGNQSYVVLQCQSPCSLADAGTPELDGLDLWLEPVAGEDGAIADAAPAQWGDGAEMAWTEETITTEEAEVLWERAAELAEKYAPGTDAAQQIFVYQAVSVPVPVTGGKVRIGNETVLLSPVE
ncbi:hypothetical protein ACT4S2_02280 [Kocuria turfanensis]|uniref:hypothetical protein n=1 Tax=Kocuria turfanensis TaxID=388357 RepID=UPI0040360923